MNTRARCPRDSKNSAATTSPHAPVVTMKPIALPPKTIPTSPHTTHSVGFGPGPSSTFLGGVLLIPTLYHD